MKHKTSPSSLRRLTRDLLQARWLFLLASLGTVAQVALTVLLPVLIGNAIDSVLLPQAEQHLIPILGQMLLVILANTLIPVSYTHLDVYKRQVLYSVLLLPTAHILVEIFGWERESSLRFTLLFWQKTMSRFKLVMRLV